MLSEALLDAEVRLGEMTKQIPKAVERKGNQYSGKWKNDSGVENPRPKSETIRRLGFTPKQVERFEMLAAKTYRQRCRKVCGTTVVAGP